MMHNGIRVGKQPNPVSEISKPITSAWRKDAFCLPFAVRQVTISAMGIQETKTLLCSDAARILNLSVMRIRQLADGGSLPCERTRSGVRLFRFQDVERLRVEREAGAGRAAG